MHRKLYCLILSLFIVTQTFASGRYDWPEEGFFVQFNADYSERNTLPDIPFSVSSQKKGNSEPLSGSLTKVTNKNCEILEVLDTSLGSKRQCAPGVGETRTLSLLKGNEEDTSDRGWIIRIVEKGEEVPVGFIAYHYAKDVKYDRIPSTPALQALDKMKCCEIEWFIKPDYQRKGIAQAAFEAVLSYLMKEEKLKPECLVALITRDNVASKGFAKRHLFNQCGNIGSSKEIEVWSRELSIPRE